MLYESPFYLEKSHGGNGLLIPSGIDVQLRVAAVISGGIDDVCLSEKVAFMSEDDGKTKSGNGLENFIRFSAGEVPAVVFDNHNHALYFWYESRSLGLIQNGATLVHIDMHSDLWENSNILPSDDTKDLKKVWEFTNFSCNVGNYIQPAMREGLVGKMIRIEGEQDLMRERNREISKNSILNLDLDFFAEDLDDISFELKREVILHFAKQVSCITISTSPFFIPGERALEYLKKLFY